MKKEQTIKMKVIISLLMAIIGIEASVIAQIPTIGLIGSYPFNGNADDESGNDNHANFYLVTATKDRCGFSNSAFYFNGIDNRISLPAESFVNLNEYTWSVWFKIDALPSSDGYQIIGIGSTTEDYQQGFSILQDGSLLGGSHNVGNNPVASFTQTAPVQAGKWIHGVMIRDNVYLRIYINGQLMVNAAGYDSLTHNQPANYGSGNHSALIGGSPNLTSPNYLTGAIDDVRIYNRALNDEEVLQLYYSKCTLSDIKGETQLCQGQQQVPFNVDPLYGASNYAWDYSGTGAAIQGEGDSITIDFSPDATSGNLTLTVTGTGIEEQSRSLQVNVHSLPSDAGPITGESEVCNGRQGVTFTVPAINEATGYFWNYDGSGAAIAGNTNSITIDFAENATGGSLTVLGINVCGNGKVSAAYPVVVSRVPAEADAIVGDHAVCSGQQNVIYSIPVIPNATDYGWNYSGSGATITGNANSISVDFAEDATSGSLTVTGQNACGAGLRSANFTINVDTCAEKPVVNIPNSFSPNGDGVNDFFVIRGLTENSTLIIFSRSGKKLVELSGYQNDWDGKDQEGHNLESGTYWYVISVSGIPDEFKGFVYLKR